MGTTLNQIVRGLPGGAIQTGVGTTAVVVDLRALASRPVKIWSDEGDLWFCFAKLATDTTLVTSGTTAASLTALIADRALAGTGVIRQISKQFPFLIVRAVLSTTGAVTVRVKPVSAGDFG